MRVNSRTVTEDKIIRSTKLAMIHRRQVHNLRQSKAHAKLIANAQVEVGMCGNFEPTVTVFNLKLLYLAQY